MLAQLAVRADEAIQIPDFRIVLPDKTQFLVEVKNFHERAQPHRPFRMRDADLQGLRQFGEIVRCDVKIAIYWSVWNLWALVPLSAFSRQDDHQVISLEDAMKANEMSALGDVHVGTEFPLRMRFVADPSKPRDIGEDGQVVFTIGDVQIYSGDRLVRDGTEQRIAMYLMFYGGWEYETVADVDGQTFVAVDHQWTPAEDHHQGFEIVSSLSSMYSLMFRLATAEEDRPGRLSMDVKGGSLGRLIPKDYKSQDLRLWRFIMHPSGAAEEDETEDAQQ